MNTLLLDRTTWDLTLDAQRNIALASDPYSVAQDVASAARLFKGELYYDTTQGVPYFQQILGKRPPLGVMKAAYKAAAQTVPGASSVNVFISGFSATREVTGQIQFKDTNGNIQVVSGPLSRGFPAFVIGVSAIGQAAIG